VLEQSFMPHNRNTNHRCFNAADSARTATHSMKILMLTTDV